MHNPCFRLQTQLSLTEWLRTHIAIVATDVTNDTAANRLPTALRLGLRLRLEEKRRRFTPASYRAARRPESSSRIPGSGLCWPAGRSHIYEQAVVKGEAVS